MNRSAFLSLVLGLVSSAHAGDFEICELWNATAKDPYVARLRCTDPEVYDVLEKDKWLFSKEEDRYGYVWLGEPASPYVIRHLRNVGYVWMNSGKNFAKNLEGEFGVRTYEICRIWSATRENPYVASLRCTDRVMHRELDEQKHLFNGEEDRYGRIYFAESAKPFVMRHLANRGYKWVAGAKYFEKTVEPETTK